MCLLGERVPAGPAAGNLCLGKRCQGSLVPRCTEWCGNFFDGNWFGRKEEVKLPLAGPYAANQRAERAAPTSRPSLPIPTVTGQDVASPP